MTLKGYYGSIRYFIREIIGNQNMLKKTLREHKAQFAENHGMSSDTHGLCCSCDNFSDKFGGDFKEHIPECKECNWLPPGTEDHWKGKEC